MLQMTVKAESRFCESIPVLHDTDAGRRLQVLSLVQPMTAVAD